MTKTNKQKTKQTKSTNNNTQKNNKCIYMN